MWYIFPIDSLICLRRFALITNHTVCQVYILCKTTRPPCFVTVTFLAGIILYLTELNLKYPVLLYVNHEGYWTHYRENVNSQYFLELWCSLSEILGIWKHLTVKSYCFQKDIFWVHIRNLTFHEEYGVFFNPLGYFVREYGVF